MTERYNLFPGASTGPAATDWVVRLAAPEADEADWRDFEAWLAAGPSNRSAFDAAQALWLEIGTCSKNLARAIDATSAFEGGRAGRRLDGPLGNKGWWLAGMGTLAVTVALAVVTPMLRAGFDAPTTTYATAKGERRTLVLADGSRVDLNSDSAIAVRIDAHRREVSMKDAEAAFDVTHDPARPFYIRVGDRTVKVVGTQFDVARRDGRLAVTVRRGVVQVSPTHGSPWAVSLTPGLQLRHSEGTANSLVLGVAADDAFAWRDGRLIYRDAALPDVVADLNHAFRRPVRLAGPQVAAMRFSGVLTLDDEARTLGRLAAMLPLNVTPSGDGVVLAERAGGR